MPVSRSGTNLMEQMTVETLRILPNAKFLPLVKCNTAQMEIRM